MARPNFPVRALLQRRPLHVEALGSQGGTEAPLLAAFQEGVGMPEVQGEARESSIFLQVESGIQKPEIQPDDLFLL